MTSFWTNFVDIKPSFTDYLYNSLQKKEGPRDLCQGQFHRSGIMEPKDVFKETPKYGTIENVCDRVLCKLKLT